MTQETAYRDWTGRLLDQLEAQPVCGYQLGQAASEPTALAALALLGDARALAARPAIDWLLDRQQPGGAVPAGSVNNAAGWTTSLAVLAWQAAIDCCERTTDELRWGEARDRGIAWILDTAGRTFESAAELGHDTTLRGWPWVAETHSWLEPTAFHVLALKTTGHGDHDRCRAGVQLLLDRQLPGGGCNYGNTRVFDRNLRPHLQPSGIALLALVGEADTDQRLVRSRHYVWQAVEQCAAAASLSWALQGLAAQRRHHPRADALLGGALARCKQQADMPWKLALLALAAQGARNPFIALAETRQPQTTRL